MVFLSNYERNQKMPQLFLKRNTIIRGVDLPGPRLTCWAWIYLGLYIALPMLTLGLFLDLVLYVVADHYFQTCYAVLCLF